MAPKKTLSTNNKGLPGLDLAEIERLLAFMSKHGLEEFEFARGDFRVALKRAGESAPASPAPRKSASRATEHAGAAVATESDSGAEPAAASAKENEHIIKSPIVGTFFNAASPEAKPFVKPGDHVKAGQVICIVEAMKLMNEIESEVSGVLLRALVENAQPVEYGQPLFAVRPDGKK
ncbi:MAG TPA: acetyl-CoA carboxylase biotin carboxyl carrier protein [Candidatus Acidoferrales bacterium]|jgi:acetyl-CoA carboxylase biotin carboxyl carrier protein|nr:acetyl-CoA carboxylase biotin carboxyl carrier protein [Candidatus Acidoferrales bacterium]